MTAITLRVYQRAAINAVAKYWRAKGGNPLVEICTGGGKSLIIAKMCQELIEHWPKFRILIVTHNRELIGQNAQEILRLWPEAPIGVNSAGLNRRDWRSQVLVAGVQSIYRNADLLGRVDLVIIDEAQLLSKKSTSMYQKLLTELRSRRPGLRLFGLTATAYRLDSGRLDEGEDRLFDKTVFSYGIADGIKDGYLSNLITKPMVAEIDTKGVASHGGEFVASQLERAAMSGNNVQSAVEEMIAYGRERQAWLAFCTGIKHSQAVCDELLLRGIRAASITSKTPKGERDCAIAAFKRGELRCLCNVNVLSVGSNFPKVDLLALLRPTKSPGLAVQQIGRGTRLSDGKSDCLILDFAKILKTHGPVDNINPPAERKKKAKDEAGLPIKICQECNGENPVIALRCEHCGFAFPRPVSAPRGEDVTHDAHADNDAVALTSQEKPKWVKPRSWRFKRHQKPDKPPTLKITYNCGMSSFSEWLSFEGHPVAKRKAAERWRDLRSYEHTRSFFVPQSVDEALESAPECLELPGEILVRRSNTKYFEVVQIRKQANAAAA